MQPRSPFPIASYYAVVVKVAPSNASIEHDLVRTKITPDQEGGVSFPLPFKTNEFHGLTGNRQQN